MEIFTNSLSYQISYSRRFIIKKEITNIAYASSILTFLKHPCQISYSHRFVIKITKGIIGYVLSILTSLSNSNFHGFVIKKEVTNIAYSSSILTSLKSTFVKFLIFIDS